jgi:hypothetical protein
VEALVDFASKFGARTLTEHAARHHSFIGDRTMPRSNVDLSVSAVAEVFQGRWLARCPFTGCEGAEYVKFDEPFFFCCECRNSQVGHSLVGITVPKAKDQIEKALLERPHHFFMNYQHGEIVKELRAQTKKINAELAALAANAETLASEAGAQ